LTKVQQTETTPNKEVFVLGVYASAVHAKWVDKEGGIKVQALAVASEPEIFWKGEGVEKIIGKIDIPKEVGKLVPANKNLNGPSGVALDDLFLKPLGYSRNQAWLCDLLPESRVNPNQQKAVKMYNDIAGQYGLPISTIPEFREDEIKENAVQRHLELLEELEKSGAKTIILLGDLPIRWFLHFFDKRTKLSQFGDSQETYGQRHDIVIKNKTFSVIPLCHPRNAARLGAHTSNWADWHKAWVEMKIKN
jgi:uracil-DNA glycosylase